MAGRFLVALGGGWYEFDDTQDGACVKCDGALAMWRKDANIFDGWPKEAGEVGYYELRTSAVYANHDYHMPAIVASDVGQLEAQLAEIRMVVGKLTPDWHSVACAHFDGKQCNCEARHIVEAYRVLGMEV